MQYGISIMRDDDGNIVAFSRGATFSGNDRPYKLPMRKFQFEFEEQPEEGPIQITATTPENAILFFDEKFNREELEIDFYEVVTTIIDLELPPIAKEGRHAK